MPPTRMRCSGGRQWRLRDTLRRTDSNTPGRVPGRAMGQDMNDSESTNKKLLVSAFGENVKRRRQALGMDVKEAAARAGIAWKSLDAFETGQRLPPVDDAVAVADALNVRLGVLLGIENDQRPSSDDTLRTGLPPQATRLIDDLENEVRRLERAVTVAREAELRWQHFSEAAIEGVLLHDGEKVLDINPQFVALFGYEYDEVRGKPLIDFVSQQSREKIAEVLSLRSTEPYDIELRHKDGTTMRVVVRARPMKAGRRMAAFRLARLSVL